MQVQVVHLGEMVEWSITTVLKTVVPRGTGGSNPSLSAQKSCKSKDLQDFFFFAPLRAHPTNPFKQYLHAKIQERLTPSLK